MPRRAGRPERNIH
jgi:hypothetical protein